jgi:hypothetical protein
VNELKEECFDPARTAKTCNPAERPLNNVREEEADHDKQQKPRTVPVRDLVVRNISHSASL